MPPFISGLLQNLGTLGYEVFHDFTGGNFGDLIHKIGVTNMSVAQRIAGARLQPTFLMADVDVVATYEL